MDLLPDDVLVGIGLSVAKLLDLRDLVRFSMASKRLRNLLLNSPANFSELIRTRVALLQERCRDCTTSTMNAWTQKRPLCPSPTSIDLRCMEELRFFECFYTSYCEEHDRGCTEPSSWMEVVARTLEAVASRLHFLPEVVLNVHCYSETSTPTQDFLRSSCCYRFERHLRRRIETSGNSYAFKLKARPWGRALGGMDNIAESGQPLVFRHGKDGIWVEIYLRLPSSPKSGDRRILELPPRSEPYETVAAPPLSREGCEAVYRGERIAAQHSFRQWLGQLQELDVPYKTGAKPLSPEGREYRGERIAAQHSSRQWLGQLFTQGCDKGGWYFYEPLPTKQNLNEFDGSYE